MSLISIIIPVREGSNPETTFRSLSNQTFKDFEVITSWDHNRGANVARNKGYELASGKYLLFSDDDIEWKPNALDILYQTLKLNYKASYSYGAYMMEGKIYCNRSFDASLLTKINYISTMSLIRRECFPGFDDEISRLQDWALWLYMLRKGYTGVYCSSVIFHTRVRKGITYDNKLSWEEARDIVLRKNGLLNENVVHKSL